MANIVDKITFDTVNSLKFASRLSNAAYGRGYFGVCLNNTEVGNRD
ncbi:MAG: hypothetical protein KBS41_00955 [Oscillospiraceae bacterium]|nr:hypothetical protein [Candidatus Equicaccousia limihippi]